MNVLQTIDTLYRGGSETLLLDYCRSAYKHGMNVTTVATGGGDLEQQYHSLPRYHFIPRTSVFDIRLVRSLRSILINDNIDIVHTHQPVSALHALAATIGLEKPVVHSIHGLVTDWKNKLALRLAVQFTSRNIAVSESMIRMLQLYSVLPDIPNRSIVYNGIDITKFSNTTGTLRNELSIPESAVLLGMVGNIYRMKDHATICTAVGILSQDIPNVYCVFAGRIDEQDIYDECIAIAKHYGIEDRIIFLGPRNDISTILCSLDTFVFSTVADTFGIALIEAMIHRVPCLVSDIPAMCEITKDGKLARLFRAGDPQSLAEQLRQSFTQPKNEDSMKRIHDYAIEEFSIDAYCMRLKNLYTEVLNKT
ncbi:MAG: glycosyltransferase [Candidatus Kapabacteria bacterium]|nr:glycosyltransferase [Candidatus Kapabacteria bacterium]